ncbi:MAG TPA: FAD:protein FMN transferase [Gaiellaceae bacterium]|nr:FAD:protein FMN transferase [Gaiellaceae bacterium]
MTRRLERLEFRAVGTTCAAAVTTGGPGDLRRAARALSAAKAEVAACERALSRFDPASDLSLLNAAEGEWTAVDRRLVESLRLAIRMREDTGGRFDPTVLPALVAAGYDRSFEQLTPRPARSAHGWRAGATIEVDEQAGCVRIEAGAAVDLGGIGKGYAATRALEAMAEAWPALPGGLVDLGGDLAIAGETPERGPWRIAIEDARTPGATLGTLLLHGGGVATSGRDRRRFGPDGGLHHLIDPATGRPAAPGPLTVTVVAPTAAEAEGHATAVAISTREEAAAHVAAHPRVAALYVPAEGEPHVLGPLPLARQRLVVRVAA